MKLKTLNNNSFNSTVFMYYVPIAFQWNSFFIFFRSVRILLLPIKSISTKLILAIRRFILFKTTSTAAVVKFGAKKWLNYFAFISHFLAFPEMRRGRERPIKITWNSPRVPFHLNLRREENEKQKQKKCLKLKLITNASRSVSPIVKKRQYFTHQGKKFQFTVHNNKFTERFKLVLCRFGLNLPYLVLGEIKYGLNSDGEKEPRQPRVYYLDFFTASDATKCAV